MSMAVSAIAGMIGGLLIVFCRILYSLIQGYRTFYAAIQSAVIAVALLGAVLGCASYFFIWFIGYLRKKRIEGFAGILISILVSSIALVLLRANDGTLNNEILFYSFLYGCGIGMPVAILTDWFHKRKTRQETATDNFEGKK